MSAPKRAKITLQFQNERNHQLLGRLAKHYGVSESHLAEDMLARELQAAALLLEHHPSETMGLLQRYRRADHVQGAISQVAMAEGSAHDPVMTRMVQLDDDVFGIAGIFS